MKKYSKTIWAFWIDSEEGPLFEKPIKVKRIYNCWCDKTGNYEINNEGVSLEGGYLTFAHKSKKEVERFIRDFNISLRRYFV